MQKDKGFTLIELVIVMVILALISVMAAPPLARMIENQNLKRTVVNLKTGILEARSRSLLTQTSTIVCPERTVADSVTAFTKAQCGALLTGYDKLKTAQKESSVFLLPLEDDQNIVFKPDSAQSIVFDRLGKTTKQKLTICSSERSYVIDIYIPGHLTITEKDTKIC